MLKSKLLKTATFLGLLPTLLLADGPPEKAPCPHQGLEASCGQPGNPSCYLSCEDDECGEDLLASTHSDSFVMVPAAEYAEMIAQQMILKERLRMTQEWHSEKMKMVQLAAEIQINQLKEMKDLLVRNAKLEAELTAQRDLIETLKTIASDSRRPRIDAPVYSPAYFDSLQGTGEVSADWGTLGAQLASCLQAIQNRGIQSRQRPVPFAPSNQFLFDNVQQASTQSDETLPQPILKATPQ